MKMHSPCKSVMVIMGENPNIYPELKFAVANRIPIIVVGGSQFCNLVIRWIRNEEPVQYASYKEIMEKGLFYILESESSEDVASFIHFLLTFSPDTKP